MTAPAAAMTTTTPAAMMMFLRDISWLTLLKRRPSTPGGSATSPCHDGRRGTARKQLSQDGETIVQPRAGRGVERAEHVRQVRFRSPGDPFQCGTSGAGHLDDGDAAVVLRS